MVGRQPKSTWSTSFVFSGASSWRFGGSRLWGLCLWSLFLFLPTDYKSMNRGILETLKINFTFSAKSVITRVSNLNWKEQYKLCTLECRCTINFDLIETNTYKQYIMNWCMLWHLICIETDWNTSGVHFLFLTKN